MSIHPFGLYKTYIHRDSIHAYLASLQNPIIRPGNPAAPIVQAQTDQVGAIPNQTTIKPTTRLLPINPIRGYPQGSVTDFEVKIRAFFKDILKVSDTKLEDLMGKHYKENAPQNEWTSCVPTDLSADKIKTAKGTRNNPTMNTLNQGAAMEFSAPKV